MSEKKGHNKNQKRADSNDFKGEREWTNNSIGKKDNYK